MTQYFDRKSAKIKPSDLAPLASAFANAEGGTIVIGIDDNALTIEGINAVGEDKINDFLNMAKDNLKPMPDVREEFVDVINKNGKPDRLLLLHIGISTDRIIYTSNDSVYLRIGDRTRELKGQDIRILEYSKGLRRYEDEVNTNAVLDDLDDSIINLYKEKINASNIPTEQVLKARGFIARRHDTFYLTHAAVLLFAKSTLPFYPSCRVRFLRYEGIKASTGANMNLVKDINIELPILRMIDETLKVVGAQLREFTSLNPSTGKFTTSSEYPPFAWQEGIINAITHRDYAVSGDYIRISMYDDRLEIQSPGKLPNIVTVDNIRYTRFSRNPKIARVLTEFGWVRELNEGVKRIYSDMQDYFLEPPEYKEPSGASVKLTLKNNIKVRELRHKDMAEKRVGSETWNNLDTLERDILAYMSSRKTVTRAELQKITNKSSSTITSRIKHLLRLKIIQRNGSAHDPTTKWLGT